MIKEKTLKEIEIELSQSDDTNEFPPQDVVTYNELKSCADFTRLVSIDRSLNLNPPYQREFVWSETLQARFIDSLAKNMPIPSICMSLDYKTQNWEVIDGKQRVSTIVKFLTQDWKLPKLSDISVDISGKSSFEIKKNHPELFRKIENVSIPVNILRCSYSDYTHVEYVFTIFSRLNSNSYKLTNQEIRNAMFNGPFNSLLKELEQNKKWQKIIPTPTKIDRLSGIEMILRFFAFHDWKNKYDGRLSRFLNIYMHSKREIDISESSKLKTLFESVVNIAEPYSDQIKSKSVADAVLYGISKNLKSLESTDESTISSYFNNLLRSEEFLESRIREGVAQKAKVINRLDTAAKVFSGK